MSAVNSVDPVLSQDQDALLAALSLLLTPMARLAIARGLPYAAVDDLLRGAFVKAARDAHPGLPPHRMVSRISTATGLNRREVTRLVGAGGLAASPRRWPAGEVFTRWLSDPSYGQTRRKTRRLPRQGPAPSFEALAQSVTRDVHPRSLLDELCRLGLARWDDSTDMVELQSDALVPKGDTARMFAFLGENVGDHLSAAVANVTADRPAHLEQAVYADDMSAESVASVRELVGERWQALLGEFVPVLEQLIADDKAAGRLQDRRVRIGLFTYSDTVAAADNGDAAP